MLMITSILSITLVAQLVVRLAELDPAELVTLERRYRLSEWLSIYTYENNTKWLHS